MLTGGAARAIRRKGVGAARALLSARSRGWTLFQLFGVVLVVCSGVALGLVVGPVGAALSSGQQVPGAAAAVGSFTAGTPFSSGQQINVVVPANSLFTSTENVKVVECEALGGVPPTDPSLCDGNTINGNEINPALNGSINYQTLTGSLYSVYALPDSHSLGESGSGPPTCNLTIPCVLYIGLDQTDFTVNHVWSQTFFVAPNGDDLGENPGDGSAPPNTVADGTHSTFTASTLDGLTPPTAVANGNDPATLTVTLLTTKGVAVPNKTVSLSPSGGSSLVAPEFSGSNVTDSNGKAIFSATDTAPETVTYTAVDTTDTVTVTQTAAVVFQAPVVSAGHSEVKAANSSPTTGSPPSTTITVTLLDQAPSAQPVSGKQVTLTGTGSATVTPSTPVTTNSSGVATFTVSDAATEQVTFTAKDSSDNVTVTQTASVTFGSLTVSPSASTVAFASPVAPAGTQGTQVTVTLLTSSNIPVPGKQVSLSVSSPSSQAAIASTNPSAPTGANGEVQFLITDPNVETATVTATDITDNGPTGIALSQTASVAFQTSAPSRTTSQIVAASPTWPADGVTTDSITVTIEDQFQQPVVGQTITLSSPGANAQCPPQAAGGSQSLLGVTNSLGEAFFACNSEVAETDTFTATDQTAGFTLAQTLTLTFTAGAVDPDRSTVDGGRILVNAVTTTEGSPNITISGTFPSPIVAGDEVEGLNIAAGSTVLSVSGSTVVLSANATGSGVTDLVFDVNHVAADGTTAATVTVTLLDFFGNPISGKTVSVKALNGSSTLTTVSAVTNNSGEAIFHATDSTQEVVSYQATDVTDNNLIVTSDGTVVFGNPPAPPPAVAFSDVVANPTSVPANGSSTAMVTVMLSDPNANFVPGKVITLTAGSGSSTITAMSSTTGSNGEATFTVSDSKVESVTYTANDKTDNVVLTGDTVTVTFITASASGSSGSSGSSSSSGSGAAGASAGSNSSTGSSGSSTSAVASSSAPTSTLAATGTPSMLPWMLGAGLFLLVLGSLGRRRTRSAA